MDLSAFKNKFVKEKYGIIDDFGQILTLVDFGNVNYWFEHDEKGIDGELLPKDDKLVVSMEKLYNFSSIFSSKVKFYYGLDHRRPKSIFLIKLARSLFGKSNAVTKNIQLIKHYLEKSEVASNTRAMNYDQKGVYVFIPKCNFDVEICIDAIRLIDKYDTLCLFSSDADFVSLF